MECEFCNYEQKEVFTVCPKCNYNWRIASELYNKGNQYSCMSIILLIISLISIQYIGWYALLFLIPIILGEAKAIQSKLRLTKLKKKSSEGKFRCGLCRYQHDEIFNECPRCGYNKKMEKKLIKKYNNYFALNVLYFFLFIVLAPTFLGWYAIILIVPFVFSLFKMYQSRNMKTKLEQKCREMVRNKKDAEKSKEKSIKISYEFTKHNKFGYLHDRNKNIFGLWFADENHCSDKMKVRAILAIISANGMSISDNDYYAATNGLGRKQKVPNSLDLDGFFLWLPSSDEYKKQV